jgi:4-aminobutyrate aminotransferase / (S)-3-amino-2-methylpropionate transaminase / 5-aminovalerate transaminase
MSPLGDLLPAVSAPLPGALGTRLVEQLASSECPALTQRRARRSERSGAAQDPIVWAEARASNVVDADGNRFVDLSAGFGAAAIGHAHPRVVQAVQAQTARLMHALGDLQPSDVKVALLTRLAQLAPFDNARVMLGLSGADAVEAALKSALLFTKKPGVLAFLGGYHGLSHGPLAACGYSEAFRAPFAAQLNPHVVFAPYPGASVPLTASLAAIDAASGPWLKP